MSMAMAMNLEQRVERLEKKVEFLSTQQKEMINHITELFNKLKARIDLSSSPSIQPSQVTAIEDTGKTIQHSHVTAIEVTAKSIQLSQVTAIEVTAKSIQLSQVDKEHIGAETSQQNKIAASVGSFFILVKRLTKEIGPKYCSKNCFSI